MKKKVKKIRLVSLFVAIIVFGTIFAGVKLYAYSTTADQVQIMEKYYQEMEDEYLVQVKSELLACGYANSGVTMTRMSLEDGGRSYEISIYNKLLDGKQERQDKVRCAIEKIGFEDQTCDMKVVFLTMSK